MFLDLRGKNILHASHNDTPRYYLAIPNLTTTLSPTLAPINFNSGVPPVSGWVELFWPLMQPTYATHCELTQPLPTVIEQTGMTNWTKVEGLV
jgi:hypothetical protein